MYLEGVKTEDKNEKWRRHAQSPHRPASGATTADGQASSAKPQLQATTLNLHPPPPRGQDY
jgi:hypothetical protein